ncbi:glycosyl-4,4'-diaponeurosporenoate acyltransferase [Fictibacillus sp. b24]|uniref:glycosyl-4,4'-diaponeurosporenoate acyltransferase CrtO family protein n=1 Tax=Fictibacillus sp. b24 TaxID=3055863 RepID=UPI0025A09085|nr:glycosyl-4,4'-diaponeurosporenoate acyltransferase [Fictibacillus sp. b24]MDM5318039.1 glycosyl-4,4'-diaponeurosporenoate acyltransferase [Fictibacillus sp. b24]
MLVELSPFWTIVINIFAWLVLHLSVAYIIHKIPFSYLTIERKWDSPFKWERNGQKYETLGIRKWKTILPDGGDFYRGGFAKKTLEKDSAEYLSQFLAETRRAELTHWLSMPPALLFFLWNPVWIGNIMIVYAILFNLPFIFIQRYNRFRLIRILTLKYRSLERKRRRGVG